MDKANEAARIFIIDPSSNYIIMLMDIIDNEQDMCVVGYGTELETSVSTVIEAKPDIVITETMPSAETVDLFKFLKQNLQGTRFLAASSQPMVYKMVSLEISGIDDYIQKPFESDKLFRHLRKLAAPDYQRKVYCIKPVVREAIIDFCIGRHLQGFHYLLLGMHMLLDNSCTLEGVTKIMYPEIAKAYNTSAANVERSMRSAIKKAWNECSAYERRMIFGGLFDGFKTAPSNVRFMEAMSKYICYKVFHSDSDPFTYQMNLMRLNMYGHEPQ